MNTDGLRSRISGDVVAPEDPNWDEARLAWNLAVDQRPALVALPESANDVIEIVEYARAHGYRIAPQGTGHNAGPLGPMPDTVLLNTERMRRVEIDAERSIARVEAGVLSAEVTRRRPSTVSPGSRGPRRTSASSATPSAAASAGSVGSTASLRTR